MPVPKTCTRFLRLRRGEEICTVQIGEYKETGASIALAPALYGSPSWARTSDLRINSPSLYQLSYRGIFVAAAVKILLVQLQNGAYFNRLRRVAVIQPGGSAVTSSDYRYVHTDIAATNIGTALGASVRQQAENLFEIREEQ